MAGVVTLCVMIDAGLLADAQFGVSPEALSVAGIVGRIDDQLRAAPHGQAIEVVLLDDGSGTVEDARRVTGRNFVAATNPAEACREGARPLLISAEPRPGADMDVWVLGDALRGVDDLLNVERRLREVMSMPVPRPLPPDRITGELISLPRGFGDDRLLRLVYDAGRTSWVILGDRVVLYSEDTDQIDRLLAESGVKRISRAVSMVRLRLVPDVPSGAGWLIETGSGTLVEAEATDAEGVGWSELRFQVLP